MLETPRQWSILYLDLDHFKAYNDVYGFIRGNDLIRLLARIASETVREYGNDDDFVGHIGGGDVVITTPDRVDAVCRACLRDGTAKASLTTHPRTPPAAPSSPPIARATRRSTASSAFPTASSRTNSALTSLEEVSRIAAEVKHKAKSLPGSNYHIHQRRTNEQFTRS